MLLKFRYYVKYGLILLKAKYKKKLIECFLIPAQFNFREREVFGKRTRNRKALKVKAFVSGPIVFGLSIMFIIITHHTN